MFPVKENPDGSIKKLKARLVSKGYNQLLDQGYGETFTPVIKPTTIKIIFTLALTYIWETQKIDISSVFTNGHLKEEIYMNQPPGFVSPDKTNWFAS